MKKALITGITGQDGSYLAELLLEKGYLVHGIIRRSSSFNTARINHIYEDPHVKNRKLILHYGDLLDSSSLTRIISKIKPDEIYNYGAQSHVAISFEQPEYTANVNALGTLRILEIIRDLNLTKKIKFYQASSSEIFGNSIDEYQNENTNFSPTSPYAISKLFSYWITKNYRDSYNMFASNGILFNHESQRRGEIFVTQKIVKGLKRIKNGTQDCLYLGNLNAKRDWGHARDFVNATWLILQHDKPDDFCIGTGIQYSVREFIEKVCKMIDINIRWKGKGINEVGINESSKKIIIRVDKRYIRPLDVNYLKADFSKAKKILGWEPSMTLLDLIYEMINSEN